MKLIIKTLSVLPVKLHFSSMMCFLLLLQMMEQVKSAVAPFDVPFEVFYSTSHTFQTCLPRNNFCTCQCAVGFAIQCTVAFNFNACTKRIALKDYANKNCEIVNLSKISIKRVSQPAGPRDGMHRQELGVC